MPKARPNKVVTYKDAKAALASLSPEELAAKKDMILLDLAEGIFDREQAALNAGITIKELRFLVSKDSTFKDNIAAIKSGSDDTMADMARKNLIEAMEGPPSVARNQVSMYADKTRGHYGTTQTVKYQGEKNIDPVKLDEIAQPDSVPQIQDKPQKERKIAKIPPDESFETGPKVMSWRKN